MGTPVRFEENELKEELTLRDYFAAAALQGMLADSKLKAEYSWNEFALRAYRLADAMLKERGYANDRA